MGENEDRGIIVYVVLDNGGNNRVRALGKMQDAGLDVVYVTSRDINVAPHRNVVVEYFWNPLGVLRLLGLNRLKRALDSVVYFPTRQRLYVTPVVNRLTRLIADDLALTSVKAVPSRVLPSGR